MEQLEFLDDVQMLSQLLQHYAISWAYKDVAGVGLSQLGYIPRVSVSLFVLSGSWSARFMPISPTPSSPTTVLCLFLRQITSPPTSQLSPVSRCFVKMVS